MTKSNLSQAPEESKNPMLPLSKKVVPIPDLDCEKYGLWVVENPPKKSKPESESRISTSTEQGLIQFEIRSKPANTFLHQV